MDFRLWCENTDMRGQHQQHVGSIVELLICFKLGLPMLFFLLA